MDPLIRDGSDDKMRSEINPSASGVWLSRLSVGRLLVFLVLFLSLVKVPNSSLRTFTPQSWEPVLSYALVHHLQWGIDIIFTLGPLGFLTSDYYWGYLFWPLLLWGIWFALVMTLALMRLSGRIYRPLAIALLIFQALAPALTHTVNDVVTFLAILVLVLDCMPEDQPGFPRLVLAGMTLAVLGQIKFTYLVLGSFACLVLCVSHLLQRRWSHAAVAGGTFVAAFLATRMAAGQKLSSLFEYVRQSWQVARGYEDAMAIECSSLILSIGVVLGLLSGAIIIFSWYHSPRSRESFLRAGLLVASLFLMWKESYTRADIHVFDWFCFSVYFVALVPAFLRTPVVEQKWSAPVAAVVLSISVGGIVLMQPDFLFEAGSDDLARIGDVATALVAPPLYKDALDRTFASWRQAADVPAIRTAIGSSTVGVIGVSQDFAVCLGLNYVPQPIFQDYCTYTAEFEQINFDFFNSDRAPEYLLWSYFDRTDLTYPPTDDGELVLTLPRLYTPVLKRGGLVLWKRKQAVPHLKIFLSPQEYTAGRMGDMVKINNEPCWLQVQVRTSWLGELRSFFYHKPRLFLDAQLTDGRFYRFQLVQNSAAYGFLFQPFIETPSDLVQFAHDGSAKTYVQEFRIATNHPRCFESDYEFRTLGSAVVTQP